MYDYSVFMMNKKISNFTNYMLRLIVIFVALWGNFLLYSRYVAVFNKEKSKGKFDKDLKLVESKIFPMMIIELLFNVFVPYPGLDIEFEY